jgi:hypothetical protein
LIVSEESRIAAATRFRSQPDAPASSGASRTGFREIICGAQYLLLAGTTPPAYRIVGDQVYAVYNVLTKASLGGWRIAARVNETFAVPAESPSGQAQIHHIKIRLQPFIQR